MSDSCLDHLAYLPTLDVVAICARDTVHLAAFRAASTLAGFRGADAAGRAFVLAEALAAVIVLRRLAALLHAIGRIAWRTCRLISRTSRPPRPRTVVERHRGRPAEVGIERADPR